MLGKEHRVHVNRSLLVNGVFRSRAHNVENINRPFIPNIHTWTQPRLSPGVNIWKFCVGISTPFTGIRYMALSHCYIQWNCETDAHGHICRNTTPV